MWPVKFTGIEPEIERKHIYFFFQPCGNVLKLFLKEDRSSATIYFDNDESANLAKALLQKPNKHNFRFEELTGSCRSFSVTDRSTRSPIQDFKTMNDDIDSTSTYMYDILGNKITTLAGDDGKMYVAVTDLPRSGLRLYTNKPSKLVYNIQIQEYMRMYLQIQMYKFACKYNTKFNEEDRNRIINAVADKINNQVAENNSRVPTEINQSNGIPTNQPEDDGPVNTPLRRPKDVNVVLAAPPKTMNVEATRNTITVHVDNKTNTASIKKIGEDQPLAGSSAYNKKNINGYGQDRDNMGFERKRSDDNMQTREVNKNRTDGTLQVSGNANDWIRSLKFISVPLNKKMKVKVSYISENNPKIAFLQCLNNIEKLESINRDVAAEATNGFNIKPTEGLICALLNNSVWNRAVIRSVEPLRVVLLDYGKPIKLRDNSILRGLSESLRNEPRFAIRVCKASETREDIQLENNGTYMAEVTKIYDDGTHVCLFSNLPSDDSVRKQEASTTPQNRNFGMNLAKAVTSTPKPIPRAVTPVVTTSKPPVKPSQPVLADDTLHHATIVDRLSGGMKVIVEFHFDTYCQDNSVVAFMCIDEEDMEIVDKVSNIPAEYMIPYGDISSVRVGDVVAIKAAKDDDTDYRCMVYKINDGIYSVAKVDAGTVEDVPAHKILKLNDAIKKLPFLTCVCTYPDIIDLKDEVTDVTFNVNAAKELSQDSSTYKIQGMSVKPWNPLVTHGCNTTITTRRDTPQASSSPEARASEPTVVLANAANEAKLQAGDVVRIINMDLQSCTFFCQTREMFSFYKGITDKGLPLKASKDCSLVKDPKENQLVIVKIGEVFYRGAINKIFPQNISVRMIDIGGYTTLSRQDIFAVADTNFANMKYCCVQFKVNGLETLEEEGISFLNKCIASKEKFTITEVNDAGISMKDSMGSNLLDKLNNMSSKPPGYWYKNLKHLTVPLGKTLLIFSYADVKTGELYFTVSDIEHRTKITELLTTLSDYCESAEKYHPVKGEICFAFCMGEWCRAHVLSANKADDEYDVFYMDFGNSDKIKSDIIRCLPDESYGQVVPLCTRFIIKDLKEKFGNQIPPEIGEKVTDTLEMGQEYEINILKQLENNTCLAEIPAITNMLATEDDF